MVSGHLPQASISYCRLTKSLHLLSVFVHLDNLCHLTICFPSTVQVLSIQVLAQLHCPLLLAKLTKHLPDQERIAVAMFTPKRYFLYEIISCSFQLSRRNHRSRAAAFLRRAIIIAPMHGLELKILLGEKLPSRRWLMSGREKL